MKIILLIKTKNKKVTFNEKVIMYTCENEKDTETEKKLKNQRKKTL